MANSSSSTAPRIQVFRPTMEEFKDFSKYLQYIESQGAHKAGLAKIIPPEGWCPRKSGYDDIDLMIPAPISQVVTGRQGLYQQYNLQRKAMHVMEFKKLAESPAYRTPPHFDYEDIERKYWKNITFNSPIYGADVSGSLYDDDVDEFNIQRLNTILDMVKDDYEIKIEGVNTAYLYFGMWKTTFAWHTEDMDLYSINYLHFGAPKSWYVVPPEHGRRLERLAAQFFHGSSSLCSAFLRHKMTIIAPYILKNYSIPFSKITQEPGEFMITFPYAYHAGFNHGFNCAESTNFALPRWIEYGKRSSQCSCRNDCVKICMDVFVRRFQQDRYELWKMGKDYGYHPEDPTRYYAAPAPNKCELALSVKRQEEKKKPPKEKVKQRRQPLTRTKKSVSKGQYEDWPESPKATKKKKARRNPPCKNKDLLNIEDDTAIQAELLNIEGETIIPDKSLSFEDETVMQEESLDIEEETMQDEPLNIECETVIEELDDIKCEEVEKPPELQPFWQGESEKAKKHADIQDEVMLLSMDEETEIASNIYYQSEADILDKFPQLKNAIHAGSLSVKLLDAKSDVNTGSQDNKLKVDPNGVNSSGNQFSKHAEEQSWRCEPVNSGHNKIKLKLVSPKYNQNNTQSASGTSELTLSSKNSEFSYSYVTHDKNTGATQKEGSSEVKEKKHNIEIKEKCDTETKQVSKIEVKKEHSPSKPVVKESLGSGRENSKKVARAANTEDNWAHPLAGLWQHEDFDFEAECNYNDKLAHIPPHCAICVVFTPLLEKDSFNSGLSNVPSSSVVKMPEFYYSLTSNELIIDNNSLFKNDGNAPLLTCVSCNVCVHTSCYGVTETPEGDWTCRRCSEDALDVQCCLCVLRGGALKPTSDGRWAHVICAILIPDTYFEDMTLKEPINISNITQNRLRLKCKYCIKVHAHKDRRGVCVQCLSGRCYLPFHVTCGYMAGVIFEANDWPEPLRIICTKHTSVRRRKPVVRQFTNVSVGESVVAKHKNRRYYWANVKQKIDQEYYSILFDDNSISKNTLPEDIISKDVSVDGPPEINEKVKIKWSDGKIYNGIFKGSQTTEIYVVEFDDGTIQHQERRQIFAADEELPKEVQSKMSHSSEGKGLTVTDISGKRMRIFNHKYFTD